MKEVRNKDWSQGKRKIEWKEKRKFKRKRKEKEKGERK